MKVKVTITLDRATWLRFRAIAIQRGVSASAEIEEFMRRELAKEKTK